MKQKQDRAASCHRNSPKVNLPDNQSKDTPFLYQNLRILWLHYGLPDILNLNSTSNSQIL